MSNYVKITDFAAKDALASGNAAKIVTGTGHDNEYNAIAVAIATKLDQVSSIASTAPSYNVTGSSAPANGIYLSQANYLTFSSNSVLRGTVNVNGQWGLAAATSGTTLTVSATAIDTTAITLPTAGSYIRLARSSDASGVYYIGNASDSPGGTSLSLRNTGGTGSELLLGSGAVSLVANAVTRLSVSATVATATQLYDPYNSINALKPITTSDTGTYTGTMTGLTTSPTGTVRWSRSGNIVIITMPSSSLSGTSNSTSCTVTGALPATIQPNTSQYCQPLVRFLDNSIVVTTCGVLMSSGSSTITFTKDGSTSGFTASGSKGINTTMTFVYCLD